MSNKKRCASIRTLQTPQYQCNFMTTEKYCSLHQAYATQIDYLPEADRNNYDTNKNIVKTKNPLLVKYNTSNIIADKYKLSKLFETDVSNKKKDNNILNEEHVSTMKNNFKEGEADLEIKLLILVNEDASLVKNLIGPCFDDVTLSEDQEDPITLDPIWIISNKIKQPANINRYYLFSYLDSHQKIRCMTLFTIKDLIDSNNLNHPITCEAIPEEAINRATQLIELYSSKLGLFSTDLSKATPEFILKTKLTQLFSKFHIHSIYFEINWLLSINDKNKLLQIIDNTRNIVNNNADIISKNFNKNSLFKQISGDSLKLKEYIVSQWEQLINYNPQNQLLIWIIASGLSNTVPEIKQKFPDLEVMMN